MRKARSLSHLSNIFCGDITSNTKVDEISGDMFDYAIFGEVIEHIGNPVNFLGSFLMSYRSNIKNVIIIVQMLCAAVISSTY